MNISMTILKITSNRFVLVIPPVLAAVYSFSLNRRRLRSLAAEHDGLTFPQILSFSFVNPQNAVEVLSSTVTFSSIICSFVGVSISVLIGLDTPAMQRIRSDPTVLSDFRNILGFTFATGLLLVFASLVTMYHIEELAEVWDILWLPLVVLCLASLVRLASLMLLTLSASSRDSASSQD